MLDNVRSRTHTHSTCVTALENVGGISVEFVAVESYNEILEEPSNAPIPRALSP